MTLFVVFLLIPGGFAFAIWNSYRRERLAAEGGEGYAPAGRVRWSDEHVDGDGG